MTLAAFSSIRFYTLGRRRRPIVSGAGCPADSLRSIIMDPNAALRLLMEALEDKDREAAVEAMDALRQWINRGGFLPDPIRLNDGRS